MKPVTLRRIVNEGRHAERRAMNEARSSYLNKYGIRNIWQHWLLKQDSRLNERTQAEICGWQEDAP